LSDGRSDNAFFIDFNDSRRVSTLATVKTGAISRDSSGGAMRIISEYLLLKAA
jgi:hypothetical protein